jgi:acetolactate synthase I/II/III large subunit
MKSRQAGFQIVDVVSAFKPLTKISRQIVNTATIPTLVRDAFRIATEERPGPILLELPEDIAGEDSEPIAIIPQHPIEIPVAHRASLDRAAEMILAAKRPLIMLGAAASRPRSTAGIGGSVRRTQIPYFTTQMAKGTAPGGSKLYMGTAALSERDYVHEAVDRADLIIAIGHDTIEKPPFIMGPNGPQVIHVSYTPATVEQVYFPQCEVVGDVGPSLELLADRLEGRLHYAGALLSLREGILERIAGRSKEDRFPVTPQRIVHDVRQKLSLVVLILEDSAYGMIRWKQAFDDFPDFGLTFGNPDFVRYAESYGAKGSRVGRAEDLIPTLETAFKGGGVHLVVVPIDYSENTRVLVDELRAR